MRRPFAGLLLLLALSVPGRAAEPIAYSLPPPTTGQPVFFEAEHFQYDRDEDRMHMQGAVKVWDSTWTIRAQELWLDMRTRVGRAMGPLRVEDKLSIVEGSSGQFNFGTREGKVEQAAAYYAPWRIRSLEAETDSRRDLWYRSARFTSCDENPMPDGGNHPVPHYYFRASTVHVKPNHYFLARNVFMYLGRTPVFYTPVLWTSLEKEHLLRTKFNPGIDRRNGIMMRSTTLYQPSRYTQGKLFVDYYQKPGLGVGTQLQYKRSENAKGAIYGYGIQDHEHDTYLTGDEPKKLNRWALAGDQYQRLASSIAFQGRLQAQSDPTFYNDYTRANAFRVTQQLVNSMAFVRSTSSGTARIAYSRLDNADPLHPRTRFARASEDLPRLDYQSAPMHFGRLPILNVLKGTADNNFDQTRGYTQRTVGGSWEGTRSLAFGHGLSLSPRALLDDSFIDKYGHFAADGSTDTLANVNVAHYEVGGTLRVRNPLGDTDLTQTFRRRLRPDGMNVDVGAEDRGVETNRFDVSHAFRPARSVYARLQSGYDFRTFSDHMLGFRDRVQPFVTDLVFAMRGGWDFTVRDDYQLEAGNRTFLAQADWSDLTGPAGPMGPTGPMGRFVRLGVAKSQPVDPNQVSSRDHYYVSQEAGWGPKDGSWLLSGALRTDVSAEPGARVTTAQLFEKELMLRKDFHDFHTLFMVRNRPGGVREFQFRVTLKLEKEDVWRKQVYTDYSGR